jgi:hypothetical protein
MGVEWGKIPQNTVVAHFTATNKKRVLSKNAVFWDVAPFGSCNTQRSGGT